MKKNKYSDKNTDMAFRRMLRVLCELIPLSQRYTIDFTKYYIGIASTFLIILSVNISAQKTNTPKPLPPIYYKEGKLYYTPDSLGNRIPDFSYCGYMAGEKAIPEVPVKLVYSALKDDMTTILQDAINYVSSLPMNKEGIRGTILLKKGTFKISGTLYIRNSGVVIRGSGCAADGTIIQGTGLSREPIIIVKGVNDLKKSNEERIINAYVPVNAFQLNIAHIQNFKKGDNILITRLGTKEWIQKLGTDHFGGGITALGWKPGNHDIIWDRKIIAIEGNTVTLDAPITTAIDSAYGGGNISKFEWPGRISNSGIENLRLVSDYDTTNLKDEDHRWLGISIENAINCWIRRIYFEHFAGSAISLLETTKQITIEDCKSLSPVSEIGGQRRNTFFTAGQQNLFQRIYSARGYHDFCTGRAASLNAFVQCEASIPYSFSGSIDSWASGTLFDIVYIDGNAISFKNLGQDLQGAGWNTANSVLWNCSASRVDCYKPPTANNWSFGTWAQFSGDGYWGESNNSIQPRSLYYGQLIDRLGKDAEKRAILLPVETEASSSPSIEQAQILTKQSDKPALKLFDFIDQANTREPLNLNEVKDSLNYQTPELLTVIEPTARIINGWLVNTRVSKNYTIFTGSRLTSPWWSGSIKPNGIVSAKPAITRFVPGRTGLGYTDNLEELTDSMKNSHIVAFEQNYALWYERRRDDHERIRRMDGDVWPPFYELPFARSGKELAWDGLSKYNLFKYNPWYWRRLSEFVTYGMDKNLILINHHYFQHNIIEAGAHWADFPWRSANNINNTGFPEPPPYAGDKRIFMAEQFYDTTNVARKAIHKAFIRQNLNNFKNNKNVIHFIGAEFTGPFHFVKFWLETINDWEKETGENATVGLSVTKDVQDSVLNDPKLSKIVDIIDIRYWAYRDDSSAYAPKGGVNLAPRQHARLIKPGKRTPEQTYRAVREYRDKFPGKAVMYSEDGWDRFGWAVFMAGGSLANIPVIENSKFLSDAIDMSPATLPELLNGQWALAKPGIGYIIYNNTENTIKLDVSKYNKNYILRWINPVNGKIIGKDIKIKGGKIIQLDNPGKGSFIAWISGN